jgi:Family of unknown function (DUF6800)
MEGGAYSPGPWQRQPGEAFSENTMPRPRSAELRRRRTRRQKLAKLRDRLQKAQTDVDRTAVLEKALKVAPWLTEEFRELVETVRAEAVAAAAGAAVAKKKRTQA